MQQELIMKKYNINKFIYYNGEHSKVYYSVHMYTSFSETSDLKAFPCVLRRYLYSGG